MAVTANDLADRLYAAYNRHDPAEVGRLYGTDAVHEEIAQGQTRQGAETIAEGLRRFLTWFPDARWEPRTRVVDPGGQVAVSYLLTATLHAPLGTIAAVYQPLSIRGVHLLHLSDGVIRRSEDYWDAATFHRQMNDVHPGETA